VVTLSVKDLGDRVRVAVRDTGDGISEDVMSRVARNEMPGNKIGLLNVHHRVKLLFGQGLVITRHHPGTEIAFTLSKNGQPLPAPLRPTTETAT
jgi:two-component system LytT family sensor kinase